MYNEEARLRKLYQMELLDTPAEKEFDEIVLLASQVAQTPISLITLLDNDRQWFKANYGLAADSTDRESAVCNYTIQSDELFEVENLLVDKRFSANKHISGGARLRYYAGVPLTTSDGFRIGSLCVLDTKPRHRLSQEQVSAMKILAQQAIKLIELRVANRHLSSLKKINARLTHFIEEGFSPATLRLKQLSRKLTKETDSKELEAALNHLRLSIDYSDYSLNNILQWSELQQGLGNQPLEISAITDIIEDCVASMQSEIARKGNQLICEEGPNSRIRLDRRSLSFILRNLLHNANKFTAGGTITVRHFYNSGSAHTSSRCYLSVTDTGTGIQPYDIRAFTQGLDMTVRKGTAGESGSGNGLLLVRNLLQHLGGKIHLESAVGSQTTAIVIL